VTDHSLSNLDHHNPIEDFACHFPEVKFAPGSKLFSNSGQPNFYFYLRTGTVRLSQTLENGQIVNMHIFYPGSFISLLSLAGNMEQYDFEAVTEVEAYQIPREVFLAEARKNAFFTFELLLHAMRGMKGLLYRIEHTASASAQRRVAGLLGYFARHQPLSSIENGLIPIEVTHQEIADWLGLTRENVSLQLKKLEDDGIIKRHQKLIHVVDARKLLERSHQD
jgi:CRP/FNR family transcriptional regulator